MSTTTRNTLTDVFNDNHGPNKSLVHDGPREFPIRATGPAGGPKDFADGMTLDTPFFYDPSQGNLLVEHVIFSGGSIPTPTIDVQSTVAGRSLVSPGTNSPTGTVNNDVPVMQFVFVPEPSTFVLAWVAFLYPSVWRRSTRDV
jgi:hypothetical protein